jgi:hypothetical protein
MKRQMLSRVVLLVPLLVSCATSQNRQFRTGTADHMTVETSLEKLRDPAEQRRVSEATIEHHPNFTLGFIEFSDEGLAWHRTQRTAVLDMMKAETKAHHGAIIVTFVPGWKHNATVCDDNVACIRRVLHSLALAEEKQGSKRAIIGVYLGWRGLSYCTEPAKTLSIWTRKRIGERLGQSQGREVVREILRIYGTFKRGDYPNTRLVIAGHSLGAGVVYSALGPLYRQALHDALNSRHENTLEKIDGFSDLIFPDLVILANPAFEADLYKRTPADLAIIEAERLHFAPQQLPLVLTVSSETDQATRTIFSLAQSLKLLFTPYEWIRGWTYYRMNAATVANYGPFITDRARAIKPLERKSMKLEKTEVAPARGQSTNCFTGDWSALTGSQCDCAELREYESFLLENSATGCTWSTNALGNAVRICGNVEIEHIKPNLDARNPFMVMSADKSVINGHNDIYNPTFVSFLIAFIGDVDRAGGR